MSNTYRPTQGGDLFGVPIKVRPVVRREQKWSTREAVILTLWEGTCRKCPPQFPNVGVRTLREGRVVDLAW